MASRLPRKKWRITRDGLLFVGGSLGLIHETLYAHPPREVLVIAFVSMMFGFYPLRMGDRERDKRDREDGS